MATAHFRLIDVFGGPFETFLVFCGIMLFLRVAAEISNGFQTYFGIRKDATDTQLKFVQAIAQTVTGSAPRQTTTQPPKFPKKVSQLRIVKPSQPSQVDPIEALRFATRKNFASKEEQEHALAQAALLFPELLGIKKGE